jgi:hypothetical protein
MAGLLAVCVICSVSHDFFTGHLFRPTAPVKYGDVDLRAARISVAPIGSMAHATVVAIRNSRQRPDLAVEMPSALGTAIGNIPKMSQPNVVLVLTESWGLARDPRVNEAETEPYRNNEIAQSYDIQSGTVGFLGATTSGETRELCGDSRGRNGESSSYDACWPAVLNRRGYRTLGVHGFAPSMFQRAEWYKEFGFSESAFLPELQRDGAKLCDGVFLGACDSDVASWIGNRLEAEHDGRPMFVHWVTLNSHLPVAAVPGNGARMACNNVGFNPDSSLCAWFNRVLKVQQSVAKLALRPGLSPTVFVIVGDHAPPFLNPAARAQFADRIVPWVILMPRTLTGRQLPHDLVASTSLTHVSGQEHEQQHHGRAAVHLHTRRDKLRVSWRAAG